MQTELFTNRLPVDITRYIYSFIYRDVMVSIWRDKYSMHDMLQNIYDDQGDEYFPELMIDAFEQHFPDDVPRIMCYFRLERERVKGTGRWLKTYVMPQQKDASYYEELFDTMVTIMDEKTANEIYSLMAGFVIMNNRIMDSYYTAYDEFAYNYAY